MNTPYRTPGEEDKTEIAREKIRAATEIKKKMVEEREETRRARDKERGDGWIVPWIVGGILSIAIPIAANVAYSSYLEHKYPTPAELQRPHNCTESVEIISESASVRTCSGGWMESEPVGPDGGAVALVKVHCRCDHPGGAATEAKEKQP